MFELVDVSVRFGALLALATGPEPMVFDSGSSVALMGPNGSGKTTLLRLLAGLQAPASGSIRSPHPVSISYVSQHQHQHSWIPLTVQEVLGIGRYRTTGLLRPFRRADREAVAAAAARLAVTDLLRRPFGELSGGQRQRVLVASSLVNDADCLLLDEPITGLDLVSQDIILEVIDAERDRGRLVVMSTHHLDEARHCDRVVLLNTTVIAIGSPESVLTAANLAAAFGSRLVTSTPHGSWDRREAVVIDDHGHGSLGAGGRS